MTDQAEVCCQRVEGCGQCGHGAAPLYLLTPWPSCTQHSSTQREAQVAFIERVKRSVKCHKHRIAHCPKAVSF